MPQNPECLCMVMGEPITDCTPIQVAPDIWTQVAKHGPGQQKGPMHITNRSIIYRLIPADGDPFLVVLNGLWICEETDQPFKGLRALEASTRARIRFILAPGAGHHLSLHHYANAFPDAQVCVADGRIPRVNTELMALPNVHAYPPNAPPPELGDAGLKVMVVGGLMEGPLTKRIALMTELRWGHVPNTSEPLMVLHEPTGTITSGGHQWWYVPADEQGVFVMPGPMAFMLRIMGLSTAYMVPGKISLEPNGGFAIHDRAALQASCQEILSWDFDKMLDVHAQLNKSPQSGAKALFEEALAPIIAGRWDDIPIGDGTLPA